MIFSKSNMLAVRVTKSDRKISALDNVHFRKDGSTIGTNGVSVIAISPVDERIKKHTVFTDAKDINVDCTVNAESVLEIIKVLGKDTKFGGVLELIDFDGEKIQLNDGRKNKTFEVCKYTREYIPYKEVFTEAYKGLREGETFTAINLQRLVVLLSCLNEICGDTTQNTILYMQITKRGDIIFRTREKRGQRIIAIVKAYDSDEGRLPELTKWEKDIFGVEEGGQSKDYSRIIYRAYEGNSDKPIKKIKRIK
ncbi:MAG: hypothetical protein A2V66_11860 [Ignavibacteria bacterium RBG_13_36_8]|nr:MAG: hypothetical protein A2V66_11860 [Ignavibacteria bacterium RBG_13_36_8]